MIEPIDEITKQQVFKSYKEKVVYILQRYVDALEDTSSELKWCLHVIKNDFLQISNSILNNGGLAGRARRFSKTQRILTFDESVETGVLNNWVT